MLGEILGKVRVYKNPQKWEAFIDELLSQEDFLPPLHTPNILLNLRTDVYCHLPTDRFDACGYKQKEEIALNAVHVVLSEKMSSEEYSPWSPDLMEQKETIRLYNKVTQLILNKGYHLHNREKGHTSPDATEPNQTGKHLRV